ncbi:MAG: hypothetical protein K2P58_09005 [Hyphomonadaceae bacterium]|nr:hypothetical protein [Hyphomonadaceae bacterium]
MRLAWTPLAIAIASLALAGCAVSDARRQQERQDLTRRIVDDAIAYNEAYSGAISGQILLNVLRAHNRQPRQYMSMSGFANSDADTRGNSVSVSGVPLGRLGEEWGTGAFGVNSGVRLEPEYRVEPFGEEDFSRIAIAPTSPTVFAHYWNAGWDRDLLLFLMVERMEIMSGGARVVVDNSPGTIAANCGDGYEIGGCAFVRAARSLTQRTNRAPTPAPVPAANGCQPVAVYDRAYPAGRAEGACPVRIVVGETEYTLTLRSLDAMVYYVGELMRRDQAHPPSDDAFLEARLSVRAAGSREEPAPLFRIVEADHRTERDYVATVTFAGRRYSAGAPANAFCYRPDDPQACRGVRGDRSGSVLEFLVGVLAYNQSDAAVRAPQNTIIR